MDLNRAQDLERLEEYVLEQGCSARGDSDLKLNLRTLVQLSDMFPYARCSRFRTEFLEAIVKRDLTELSLPNDFFKVRRNNFYKPLRMMIEIEEAWDHIEMRRYDGEHVLISSEEDPSDPCKMLYKCEAIGVSEMQPSVIPYDNVILSDGVQAPMMFDIVEIDRDSITFTPAPGGDRPIIGGSYWLSFLSSGSNYDRYYRALEIVENSATYKNVIYPPKSSVDRSADPDQEAKIDFATTNTRELEKRLEKFNNRQRRAIINIVEAKSRPSLYVLFGPPGTGKTSTLVEIIVQIYKRAEWAKMLVCSSSNTCVDFIADLIADTNEIDSMARLISRYNYQKVESRSGYYTTNVAEANLRRLVLTTNSSAARLRSRNYDYVIIDEAGHSHIPESLVPLTRLKEDGCLVLAGDPQQLGPTIKCPLLKGRMVTDSLLHRVCQLRPYTSEEGQYNERYITKLIDSFRCDPRILGLSNKLFYENELNCLGKTPPELLRAFGLDEPLVFVSVTSVEMRHPKFRSRCNYGQADSCIDFLIKLYQIGLRPDQIGIITPYRFQRNILINELEKRIASEKAMLNNLLKSNKKFQYKEGDTMDETQVDKENLNPLARSTSSSHNESAGIVQSKANQSNGNKKRKNRKPKTQKWVREFNWTCKIDTVDAFQGSEREIILISTVRSPVSNERIDMPQFLSDLKRFNVSISRAKWLVVVFGHEATLKYCGKGWREYNKWSTRMIV